MKGKKWRSKSENGLVDGIVESAFFGKDYFYEWYIFEYLFVIFVLKDVEKNRTK